MLLHKIIQRISANKLHTHFNHCKYDYTCWRKQEHRTELTKEYKPCKCDNDINLLLDKNKIIYQNH